MFKPRHAVFALLIVLCVDAFAADCGPKRKMSDVPLEVVAQDAQELLVNRDFDALTALSDEYRDDKKLTSDGKSKNAGFYNAMSFWNQGCGSRLRESDWGDRQNLIGDWIAAKPKSVGPILASACFQVAYAWHARGGGYSGEVSEEGWKFMAERVANARAILEQPKVKAANDPAWYKTMLEIGLLQGWKHKEYEKLFNEAVRKHPLFYTYYIQRARYYEEKWNGAEGDFQRVVDDAVNSTKPLLGQSMYARLHWAYNEPDMFTNGQTDWKRMKQGFVDILAKYPDAYNRNNFAQFACRAGDWETYRQQIALIGQDMTPSAWGQTGYYWCIDAEKKSHGEGGQ